MDINIMPVDFLLRKNDSEQAIANLPLPQEVSHDNPSLGLLDRLPREMLSGTSAIKKRTTTSISAAETATAQSTSM
jgi:hypothetical protein